VCCASAGAERRGGVLCAGPAYVVIPQGKKKKKNCIKISFWFFAGLIDPNSPP
jgi:hypothetical protein